MGSRTGIEWTEATWNPVSGCTKLSRGCDHCFAERALRRISGALPEKYPAGFRVTLHEQKLWEPLTWKRARRILTCSISDLFHEEVPFDYLAAMFAVMAATPRHRYLVLTKRPPRLLRFFRWLDEQRIGRRETLERGVLVNNGPCLDLPTDLPWPLPNVALGTSFENQATADIRIQSLLAAPAALHFGSYEPALGPVTLRNRLDWVIAGGETGPWARPSHPSWFESMRDQCCAEGAPYFFKSWGDWGPQFPCHDEMFVDDEVWDVLRSHWTVAIAPEGKASAACPPGGLDDWIPGDLGPGSWNLCRVGKKRSGRILGGRTWDEIPEVLRV